MPADGGPDFIPNLLRPTHLDRAAWAELREQVAQFEIDRPAGVLRTYPGYPTFPLQKPRPRRWSAGLDSLLATRRSSGSLSTSGVTRHLGRLLYGAHAALDEQSRGPAPSAGGLQTLELYLVHWGDELLPAGVYHYERAAHQLAQLVAGATRAAWREMIPSLDLVSGGAVIWLLVSDLARLSAKYGRRAPRFSLLEAGHVMQNLCLVSASVGLTTVPLGAIFEAPVKRTLMLPETDEVSYAGLCGVVPPGAT